MLIIKTFPLQWYNFVPFVHMRLGCSACARACVCAHTCAHMWVCVCVCVCVFVCVCGGGVRGKVLKETDVSLHKVPWNQWNSRCSGLTKLQAEAKQEQSRRQQESCACVFKEPEVRTCQLRAENTTFIPIFILGEKRPLFLNWELWFCAERKRSGTRLFAGIKTAGSNADAASLQLNRGNVRRDLLSSCHQFHRCLPYDTSDRHTAPETTETDAVSPDGWYLDDVVITHTHTHTHIILRNICSAHSHVNMKRCVGESDSFA